MVLVVEVEGNRGMSIGEPSIAVGEIGSRLCRFFEEIDRVFDAGARALSEEVLGLQEILVSVWCDRVRLAMLSFDDGGTEKMLRERFGDGMGYLVLQRQDVGHVAVIGVRPDFETVRSAHELGRDAHTAG